MPELVSNAFKLWVLAEILKLQNYLNDHPDCTFQEITRGSSWHRKKMFYILKKAELSGFVVSNPDPNGLSGQKRYRAALNDSLFNEHTAALLIPMLNVNDIVMAFSSRRIAGVALKKIGERDASVLIKALGSNFANIREGVIALLGEIRDPEAVEPVIKSLKDRKAIVRKAAAESLGKLGDSRAVDGLVSMLGDKDPGCSSTAAMALERLHWIPSSDKELLTYNIALKNWKKLVTVNDPAIEALIELLKDKKLHNHEPAAVILAKLEEGLIGILIGYNVRDRGIIIELLGDLRSKKALDLLINYLDDDDYQIQIRSIYSLGKISDARIVNTLVERLVETNRDVRYAIKQVLGASAIRGLPVASSLVDFLEKSAGELDYSSFAHYFEVLETTSPSPEQLLPLKPLLTALILGDGDEGLKHRAKSLLSVLQYKNGSSRI